MSIEAIAPIGTAPMQMIDPFAAAPADPTGAAFEAVMSSFESLNEQIAAGQSATTNLALGQADNLHQIMINGEQTRLTFELMLAVRNKVLEAYQELMRMQV
jgi:flagellar hook-basal body complex protein FliE